MKLNRHLSHKISAAFAASILSIALTGTACGTFAWFMYGARTRVTEFEGTSIGVVNLDIGILSEEELSLQEADSINLVKDDSNPEQIIYWSKTQNMSASTINYVLDKNGYTNGSLHPATTRRYSSGDDFGLSFAPNKFINPGDDAMKTGRIYLPLVFRCTDIIDETDVSNEKIYLSKVQLEPISRPDSDIHKAVRFFTDDKTNLEQSTHLINWSSSEDGSTDVGGVLDLNKDGYYDTFEQEGKIYERIYGQVKDYEYKSIPEEGDTPVHSDTFHAGHRGGVYAVESCTPEVANYEGNYGFRNMSKSVTTTNPLTNNYAYLDISIFIEGWDEHVIDTEINSMFNINLQFETKI